MFCLAEVSRHGATSRLGNSGELEETSVGTWQMKK